MAWESVVDDAPPSERHAEPVPESIATSKADAPTSELGSSIADVVKDSPEPASSLTFAPLNLTLGPSSDDFEWTEVVPHDPVADDDDGGRSALRSVPFAPIVPALDDDRADTPGSPDTPDTAHPGPTPDSDREPAPLPVIVEATVAPEIAPLSDLGIEIVAGRAAPSLPQANTPAGRAAVMEQFVDGPAAPAPARTHHRRTSRRGPKLLAMLVVLGGLAAAGVVFGRPYLFPSDWDEVTEPYAIAVETARSVDFVEPISIVAEPTADFTDRLVDTVAGDWQPEEPAWRALGLMNGVVTEEGLAELFAGWQNALYSEADGQVYRDSGTAGPQADAAITEAMASASLDQQYAWSADQSNRGLDAHVETLAEVRRQARAILAASSFAVTVEPADASTLTFAPPVIGYRALAPVAFAEFAASPVEGTETTENRLAGIGLAGAGPLSTSPGVAAPGPALVPGDASVGSPRVMDRAFWYLVFAGYLDSRTAYGASEAVVQNTVSIVDRAGSTCQYSTFAGGDLEQTATLRSGLEAWAAAVPSVLAPAVSVLPDGTLQLSSCDPGAGFVNGSRLGVARELVAWRTAELATREIVAEINGAPTATIPLEESVAWSAVASSTVVDQLVALPAETMPADVAETARAGVRSVLTPAA